MDSKSIFASKTLWVNLLGPFFAWLASKGLALTPDQQLAFVGIGMAGVNVLLRLFTKQPVHVVTPPSAVVALIATGIMLLGLSACSGDPQKDAAMVNGYVVAFQPLASAVACKAQAGANIAGASAESKGDTNGASIASVFSQANGLFCNGLPAGAPLPQPVTSPLPTSALGAAPVAVK